MPMSGDVLGPQIATALAGLSDAQKADTSAIWKIIATEIVTHIATMGVVTTTGSAAAQTGKIS